MTFLGRKITGICSTYMRGPETSRSLLDRNLFYLYEGPRDLQKPFGLSMIARGQASPCETRERALSMLRTIVRLFRPSRKRN